MTSYQAEILSYIKQLILPEILTNELNISIKTKSTVSYPGLSIETQDKIIAIIIFKPTQTHIVSKYHNITKQNSKLKDQINSVIDAYRKETNDENYATRQNNTTTRKIYFQ